MKKLIIYLKMLSISIVVIFAACERDENGPMPDDLKDGALPFIRVSEESDLLVDVADKESFVFSGNVEVLFEPEFSKIILKVVHNGDYTNPYVLIDNITSTPHEFSVSLTDLISAIPAIGDASDITEGDVFVFYADAVLEDGTVLRTYLDDGRYLVSSSLLTSLNALEGISNTVVNVPVPCELVLDDYLGVLDATEDWGGGEVYNYTVTVEEDPDYSGENIGLIIRGLFDGANISTAKAEIIRRDLSVSIPDQIVIPDITAIGYPANYEYLHISTSNGSVNTCSKAITFSATWCVALGCFGGAPVYTLTKPVEKSNDFNSTYVPIKREL